MPERVIERSVEELIDSINSRLNQFKIDYRGWTLRQKVQVLADFGYDARCLNVNVVREHGYSITAAKDRLRLYLNQHVMIVLDSTELDVVSGISDYPRRIRELRVEEGYEILTGASADKEFGGVHLKPDQYLLLSDVPDITAARRWHIANRIRRTNASVKDKILEYLRETIGQTVTTEELSYVARGKKEFARRVRELRTEDGYAIYTKITGRPDLNVGEYVLMTLDRIMSPHDRHIPIEVQREVYQRDNNRCRACGWSVERGSTQDPRILELHHLRPHAERGENATLNLIILCSRCHDEVHADRLDISHIVNPS